MTFTPAQFTSQLVAEAVNVHCPIGSESLVPDELSGLGFDANWATKGVYFLPRFPEELI